MSCDYPCCCKATRNVIARDYLRLQGSVKLLAIFSRGFSIFDSENDCVLYKYEFCQKPSNVSFLSAVSGRKIRGEVSRP